MAPIPPDAGAHAGPCPPAADLTAFAHGEFPEWHRAEISRHLLRCPACRDAAEGARDVLARLAALGTDGDAWRDDLAAAGAALSLSRRRSGLAVALGAAAAAGLAVGVWLLPAPGTPSPRTTDLARHAVPAGRDAPAALRRPSSPAAALSSDERRLLATQRPDGRWKDDAGTRALASDEAATGLSLLALAARRPEALRGGPVGRAAGAATAWLVGRRRADAATGSASAAASADGAGGRDRAISAAALLEVWSATREPTLYPAVDAAVRDVARRVERARRAGTATDDADARWSRATLSRARDLGWRGLEAPLRRLPDAPRAPDAASDGASWPVAPVAPSTDSSALACAMRVLSPRP